MGAHDLTATLDGKLTPSQIQDWFAKKRDQAAYESGVSYSGDWNMMTGVHVEAAMRPFPNLDAAREYVLEHTEKWEHALAVKFTARHEAPLTFAELVPGEYSTPLTYTTAMPASAALVVRAPGRTGSMPNPTERLLVADLVPVGKRDRLRTLAKLVVQRAAEQRAAAATLRPLVAAIENETGPEPDWPALKTARKALVKATALLTDATAGYAKLADPIYAKRAVVDDGTKWFVGGWAAE